MLVQDRRSWSPKASSETPMQRHPIASRHDWQLNLRQYPYGAVATSAAAHWDESAYYSFSADEIDRIETAANSVYGLIIDTLGHAIDGRLLPLLGYSAETGTLIRDDWNRSRSHNGGSQDPRAGGLYGRLDFAYDGGESLKLVGCHFDGPTGLFESAIVQWNWLEARFPDADQFNGLHETLVERWQALAVGLRARGRVHLTCATPDAGREGELAYLAALAEEAGLKTATLAIQDIGWDGGRFRDLDDRVIAWLLKLYPWEALVADSYGAHLGRAELDFVEPLWRMPASNHGLLALLWERYPQHPHLSPASLTESAVTGGPVLTRSQFGLDRAAQRLTRDGRVIAETPPAATPGGMVHLALPPYFEQDGICALLQCWLVGDKCLGMAVRESESPLFDSESTLVPHLFR
ncbi:putative Glutathionylspermidine synthase [Azospirillaceae bacterium]